MTEKKHAGTGNRNAAKTDALDGTYSGRCKKAEKAAWVKVSQQQKMTLQELTRKLLNAEAERVLNPEVCPKCQSDNFKRFEAGIHVGAVKCYDCGRD
jgi:hypothetical protein